MRKENLMPDWYQVEENDKRRLWNHILIEAYGTSDLGAVKKLPPDPEGHAFFLAIDAAFSSSENMKGCVPVDRELVQYLAGWARDSSNGYDERGGPLDARANHFVSRAFNGFIQTLRRAVMTDQLRYFEDGRVMYGSFLLPQWLIDKYLDEARHDAEHMNKLWDEQPNLRYVLRRQTHY